MECPDTGILHFLLLKCWYWGYPPPDEILKHSDSSTFFSNAEIRINPTLDFEIFELSDNDIFYSNIFNHLSNVINDCSPHRATFCRMVSIVDSLSNRVFEKNRSA